MATSSDSPFDPFHPNTTITPKESMEAEKTTSDIPKSVSFDADPMPQLRKEALCYFEEYDKEMHWSIPYIAATFWDEYASAHDISGLNVFTMTKPICLLLACVTFQEDKWIRTVKEKSFRGDDYTNRMKKMMFDAIDCKPITPLFYVNHLLDVLPEKIKSSVEIGHIYAILVQGKTDSSLVFERPSLMAAAAIVCYARMHLEPADGVPAAYAVQDAFTQNRMTPEDLQKVGKIERKLLSIAQLFGGEKDKRVQKRPIRLTQKVKELVGLAAKHGDGQQRKDMLHISFPLHWRDIYERHVWTTGGDAGGGSSSN